MLSPDPEPPHLHVPVSWDNVQHDAALLAQRLVGLGPWKGIVAVARGGLVPAALVARALDIRLIETVSIATYSGSERRIPKLWKQPSAADDGAGWLVVDDLVDTGVTMRIVRGILPRAHVAALYAKPLGEPLADSFVRAFPQSTWIDFPWEMEVSVGNLRGPVS
jgi:xanthine phosphoribosyltransferase